MNAPCIHTTPHYSPPSHHHLSAMDTTLQTLALPEPNKTPPVINEYSSNVDTSRPFRSVKEAVAVFGERLLLGEIHSPKPFSHYSPPPPPPPNNKQEIIPSWRYYSPSPTPSHPSPQNPPRDHEEDAHETLKRLEAELGETKTELKLLKKRGSETEIALATLNAELHKNMSKLAEAEAAAAKTAAASSAMRNHMNDASSTNHHHEREIIREEEKMRELMIRMESSPTLAQILSMGDQKAFGGKKEKKMMMIMKKKKPIVPLVTDLFFFKKKGSSTSTLDDNPLYASPNMYFN